MSIHNPELVRLYIRRKLKDLRIFVSCMEPTEHDALAAMEGSKGQKIMAGIETYILEQLSHHAAEFPHRPAKTAEARVK